MAQPSSFDDQNSLFDFVVTKGNGVKGLVDSGIIRVPQLFIQPPRERIEKINGPSSQDELLHHFSSVPIDLSKLHGPDHNQVKDAIVRASETMGCFQVINHGLDLEFLESVKEAAHRFFEQPTETKAAYLQGVSPIPSVRYTTSLVPEKENTLQWRDYLRMIYTSDVDAQNHWPKACNEEALEYLKLCSKIERKILEILIENLGVKLDDSRLEAINGAKVVNMNYYPACPNPELTVGTGRHADIGILTLLLQDGIGGLYVKIEEDIQAGRQEEWIEIPPIPGALVVNVGDALQILSNGRYISAEHRVRTTRTQSRVSIPCFSAPRLTEKIGPLPELVERDGGTRYREFVFQEYSNIFHSKGHQGKDSKLDFFKINSSE